MTNTSAGETPAVGRRAASAGVERPWGPACVSPHLERADRPRSRDRIRDMTDEETLDPQDWAALRALGHRAARRRDGLHGVAARAPRVGARAGAREGALRRAAAGGSAAHRGHLPRVRRVRAALPARQQPPALLGLGAGQRHADGGDRGDAGGGHRLRERHLLLREQQLRRAAGAGLVQGAARVPAGRRRAAHERLLGLEPDRAGGGAERQGRVRRARRRAWRVRASPSTARPRRTRR